MPGQQGMLIRQVKKKPELCGPHQHQRAQPGFTYRDSLVILLKTSTQNCSQNMHDKLVNTPLVTILKHSSQKLSLIFQK